MVNVHIHQFTAGSAVVDAAALKQFQEQWATYRKLIASNYLSHREVGGTYTTCSTRYFDPRLASLTSPVVTPA